jgi:hypothetical protein
MLPLSFFARTVLCVYSIFIAAFPNITVNYFITQDKTKNKDISDIRSFWNSRIDKNELPTGFHARVIATQEYGDLLKHDITVLFDYQDLFHLNSTQMDILYQHLKYWDILRRCCGTQLSKLRANQLLNKTSNFENDFLLRSYPACEMYDLTTVERLFLNTVLSKAYPKELFLSFAESLDVIKKGICDRSENKLVSDYKKKRSNEILASVSQKSM